MPVPFSVRGVPTSSPPPVGDAAANAGSLVPWADAFILGGSQPDDIGNRLTWHERNNGHDLLDLMMDGSGVVRIPVVPQFSASGAYTLAQTDAGRVLSVGAEGETITLPAGLQVGSHFVIDLGGFAGGTLQGGSSTVVNWPDGSLTGAGGASAAFQMHGGYTRYAVDIKAQGNGETYYVVHNQGSEVAGIGVGAAYPSYAQANLPKTGLVDGQHVRCSDCTLNGLSGVDVVWNASAGAWTDALNQAAGSW